MKQGPDAQRKTRVMSPTKSQATGLKSQVKQRTLPLLDLGLETRGLELFLILPFVYGEVYE
jgi:hypothetical protein